MTMVRLDRSMLAKERLGTIMTMMRKEMAKPRMPALMVVMRMAFIATARLPSSK